MGRIFMMDELTIHWLEEHPGQKTPIVQCKRCGENYKPGIGHACNVPAEDAPWLDTCPWCKSSAEIVPANSDGTLFTVGCTGETMCFGSVHHVTMIFTSAEAAAEAWNRRVKD